MRQVLYVLSAGLLVAGLLALGSAQDQKKQKKAPLSPPAQASAAIGGKNITIDYSAPSMRGRKIFGGLVPYGKVWRAGANKATTLKTEADLQIGALDVPKGEYTLYVWPEADRWQLIVNKQTGQWGTVYNQDQDLGRVPMQMSKASAPAETFAITLTSTDGNKGELKMAWEDTVATAPITVK
ncbi:MAG: DUF2911 domain-containing protein [Bryobacteraceae bacterium]